MKQLKRIAAALLCMAVTAGGMSAKGLNTAEENAQKAMMEYLRGLSFAPTFDNRDNSVNFKKNDILYWITVDGNSNGMLYTLHHRPIKLTDGKEKQTVINRKCEVAERAAGMLTAKMPYKSYLKGSQVQFEFPVYAATVKEYQAVFPKVLTAMSGVKKEFDACYDRSKIKTDSIHRHWQSMDTLHLVVPQTNLPVRKHDRNMSISGISVRNVDANGVEISGYDEGLRQNKMQFIQPRIALTVKKPGIFKIGIKIITPKGKIMVPAKDVNYTMVSTVDAKNKKETIYPLDVFGQAKKGLWEPGEYKILFYEDDTLIYEDAFHVL